MDGERVSALPAPAEAERVPAPDVAAARGTLLLTLQRRIGNRAVGRLLQRQDGDGGATVVAEPFDVGAVELATPAEEAKKERESDQKGISTPLPSDAIKDPLDGNYYVTRGDVRVEIQSDAHGMDHTETKFHWKITTEPSYTSTAGKIDAITTPVVSARIQTEYETGVTPSGPSAYGRGTTTEDKAAGNTSLRFHEGCHGVDFLEYIAANPPPKLGVAVGDSETSAKKKIADYKVALEKWNKKGQAESEKKTDLVGIPGKHTD